MSLLTYLDRNAWGATVATTPYLMRLPAVGVHCHHSVTIADDDHDLLDTGDVIADMREIEQIGKQRFGRFPYSFCIHPSGVIGEGAGLTVGAHTEGWNSTTFGVCLIGNYEHDVPTDAQVAAFGQLYRHLVANSWLVPDAWIEPHRARKATACPGAHTIGRWADLVSSTQEDDMTPDELLNAPTHEGKTVRDTLYWAFWNAEAAARIATAALTAAERAEAAAKAQKPAAVDVDAIAAAVAAKAGAGSVNLQVSGAELTALVKDALKDALREGTGA